MSAAITTVCLLRLGAVVGAETCRFIGHLDVPLSPGGEAQCARLAARLAGAGQRAIYAGDLGRARRSVCDLATRAWPALETIADRHAGQAVAVVAHGGTNRAALCRAMGVPFDRLLAFGQDYAALTVLERTTGRWSLRCPERSGAGAVGCRGRRSPKPAPALAPIISNAPPRLVCFRPQARCARLRAGGDGMAHMVDPLGRVRGEPWRPRVGQAWEHAGEVGPPVDLYETDETVIVRMAIPGAEGASLSLSVDDEGLTLRGESPPPGAAWAERTIVHWQEIPHGRFERRVPLPVPVDAKTSRASFKNGVLEVTIRKVASRASRTIEIPVG